MPLIGSHARVTGGLASGALKYAADVGAEVIQVFVSNPRGWAASAADPAQDKALRDCGMPVFVHAPYLINLGSADQLTAGRSARALGHALRRGRDIGASGVVVHTGSAVGWDAGRALHQVKNLLTPLLDQLADDDPDLLLEPMAGQGQMLCSSAADLGPYLDAVGRHPRAGLCLDTCHLFAAGHDLTKDVTGTLAEVDHAAGEGRLKLVHANDSKDPCGSGLDRHAAIGTGQIGTAPFAELLRLLPGVPFVVETPGGKAAHAADIAVLKGLRADRPPGAL